MSGHVLVTVGCEASLLTMRKHYRGRMSYICTPNYIRLMPASMTTVGSSSNMFFRAWTTRSFFASRLINFTMRTVARNSSSPIGSRAIEIISCTARMRFNPALLLAMSVAFCVGGLLSPTPGVGRGYGTSALQGGDTALTVVKTVVKVNRWTRPPVPQFDLI